MANSKRSDPKMRTLNKIEWGKYGIYFVLVLMFILSSIFVRNFLSQQNLFNILKQMSVIMIVALAQTLLITMGYIDLAAGSELALAGIISIYTYFWSSSLLLSLVSGVVVGIFIGFLFGIFTTKLGVPAFIVGLALAEICRGSTLLLTGGYTLYNIGKFTVFGQGNIVNIPMPVIFAIAIVILSWLIMNKTKLGRYIYAVGGNKAAAQASGINVNSVIMKTYMLSSGFIGLSGVVLMSRLNAGLPDAGVGYEFQGITAAVIGGTSMLGGIGTVQGTIVGALVVGVLQNVMNLLSIQSFVQQVVKGVIILAAVIYDMNSSKIMKSHK